MREETRRKLDRLDAGAQRTKWLVIGAGLAIVLGISLVIAQPPAVREVEAEVRFAVIVRPSNTGQPYTRMEFTLGDGRVVQGLGVAPALPPRPGTRIIVSEHLYWLGYRSYQWEGKMP